MSAFIRGARTSWRAKITTVIERAGATLVGAASAAIAFVALAAASLVPALDALAQGVREHTRPTEVERDTAVSAAQAIELTLTLVAAQRQPLQTWVRTAGTLDEARKTLTACVNEGDAAAVHAGQRVRAFHPDSKSSIYQARISGVVAGENCVRVHATLSGTPYGEASRYVMEIIVDHGTFLSIPNEAIIEEGDKQIVYVQMHPGHYLPREIRTGQQGELYTEILAGLDEGEQVVTIGSFFIDADHKLKAAGDAMSNAHQHH